MIGVDIEEVAYFLCGAVKALCVDAIVCAAGVCAGPCEDKGMVAKGCGVTECVFTEAVGGGLDVLGVEALTVFIKDIEIDFSRDFYFSPCGYKVTVVEGF